MDMEVFVGEQSPPTKTSDSDYRYITAGAARYFEWLLEILALDRVW